MYDAVPRQVQPKNSKCGRTQRESPQADSKSVLATVSLKKSRVLVKLTCRKHQLQIRSSTNAVSGNEIDARKLTKDAETLENDVRKIWIADAQRDT
jgi:hypothetical protein